MQIKPNETIAKPEPKKGIIGSMIEEITAFGEFIFLAAFAPNEIGRILAKPEPDSKIK